MLPPCRDSSSAFAAALAFASSAAALTFASSAAALAFASSAAACASSSVRAFAAFASAAFASRNSRSRSSGSVNSSSFSRASSRLLRVATGRIVISPFAIDDGTTGDSSELSSPTDRGVSALQSTSTDDAVIGTGPLGRPFLPFLPRDAAPLRSGTTARGISSGDAAPTSHSSSPSSARWLTRPRVPDTRRSKPTSAARDAIRSVSSTRNGLSSSASARLRWPSNSRSTSMTSPGRLPALPIAPLSCA